ncbi:MAG: MBL fold metallo-hydrolase, partial [Bacteroidota bacterium]
ESLKTTILGFDNGMLILPGHDSRPIGLDGQAVAARLGELRPVLERLAAGRDEFVAGVLGSLGAKPPNFRLIMACNEGTADPAGIDPLDLEAGPNRCAVQGKGA